MIARANSAMDSLAAALDASPDLDFASFARGRRLEDRELGELIEVDARRRITAGLPVDLERYLPTIADVEMCPVALDAAIEFALRSQSGGGQPTTSAVDSLVARYPDLELCIRNAAALNAGMATTQTMRDLGASPAEHDGRRIGRLLPAEFGPLMGNGVHRYELVDWLGGGSQGEVYLAIDRAMSQPDRPARVAIKLPMTALMSDRERWLAMEEASRARRVTHENVVRVLDRAIPDVDGVGEDYIVYEHVSGGDLGAWLREKKPDARAIARMMARIARGVQAAHQAGLVHRDLKPANILVTDDGIPKITDFGAAALIPAAPASSEQTARHGVPAERLGNLAFIAPEQYRGEAGALNSQVDVYALGGILFHALTGKLPHGWTATSVERALGAPRDPESDRVAPDFSEASVDRDLVAIVTRALAERPEDRYATADALATDLEAWAQHEPIAWQRPSMGRRARLLVRRAPRQVALGIVSTLLIATAVGLAATISARANARVRAAEIQQAAAKAYADTQVLRNQQWEGRYARVQATMRNNLDLEPSDWLPIVTILESIMGPYLFGDGVESESLWDHRIETVSKMVASARASGTAYSIQTLLWSDVLTYWLNRAGRFKDALAYADAADAGWCDKLSPDDPWRLVRAGLRSIAETRLRSKEPLLVPRSCDPALEFHAQTLQSLERYLEHSAHGCSLHRYVVDTLIKVYGPRMLNKPDEQEWALARYRKLGVESVFEQRDMISSGMLGAKKRGKSIWD